MTLMHHQTASRRPFRTSGGGASERYEKYCQEQITGDFSMDTREVILY